MATKTFKIGEYCKGGIITVEITGKVIEVIGKDWDYSTGTRRNSDQKNAKEWTRGTILSNESQARWKLERFIGELTTSYYTGKVIEWIESKTKLN
jgi:hypothetical protein